MHLYAALEHAVYMVGGSAAHPCRYRTAGRAALVQHSSCARGALLWGRLGQPRFDYLAAGAPEHV